jgi:hypothetical protein
MDTLDDVIGKFEVPSPQQGEDLASWGRRIYRSGAIAGAGWGLQQLAPATAIVYIPSPDQSGAMLPDEDPVAG